MDEKKPKKRRAKRTAEMVDFTNHPELHDWITERAAANFRSISQEICARLAASKRSVEAGKKNLKCITGE